MYNSQKGFLLHTPPKIHRHGLGMSRGAYEVNFDGLVGPTHTYGGLAYGNVAAMKHALTVSNPRAALMQGLNKMKLLADLGVKQAVLPPHERPDTVVLRRLGFRGSDVEVIAAAARVEPALIGSCYSSSHMWAANAATVSPSADTADAKVHFTPANLVSQFHRCIEVRSTATILERIFPPGDAFAHHLPLPACTQFSDEGAANHSRLTAAFEKPGVELFVYGRRALDRAERGPSVFPARQTIEASQAIARLHHLQPEATVFARQNPHAIDAGVFHNDVISVTNGNVFLYHSQAFADQDAVVEELWLRFSRQCHGDLFFVEILQDEVSLQEAVETYLFNSQLVTLPDRAMCLIAPVECEENVHTRAAIGRLIAEDNPIEQVIYVDVRQSMKNGGGPACLRLRVVLTEDQIARAHQGVFVTEALYGSLISWGERHYRDRLAPEDLLDPLLIDESRAALDELTSILKLGSIYEFQT